MSSIPLAANNIQIPPSPVDNLAKMLGVRGLMQNQQQAAQMQPLQLQQAQNAATAGQLENQQTQLKLQDQQGMSKALADSYAAQSSGSSGDNSSSGTPQDRISI